MNSAPILIIQPTLSAKSETFLLAHANLLTNVVGVVYHVNGIPFWSDSPISSQKIVLRAVRKICRVVQKRSWKWALTIDYIKVIHRTKAKVVLAEYGTTGVDVLDACKKTKVPLVVHFHGFDASKRDLIEKMRNNYIQLFNGAASIVVVSSSMKQKLIELHCPEEKIILNPCGVDCTLFQPGNPGLSGLNFLAVGRMVEKKAPHLTILAFAKVLEKFPKAKLVMIGDGPLYGVCRDLICARHIEHAVTLMGAQSHEVVAREMRKARAFVQHSVVALDGDSEGTPVAILEAGASGLPVVATRHAGIQDVILEEVTGLLVDERDIDSMCLHLCKLANEPEYAKILGQNAVKHICNLYSINISIDRLNQCISVAASL